MPKPLINISRRQAYTYAVFLVLYEFLTYISNDMIMPGMLEVVHSFNGPESAVAASLSAYMLGGASLQLLLGPLSDAYGRRPVMIFGVSLFLAFTVLIACSNSIEFFLTARFFQGMGLCFITVIGYATIQEIFREMDAIRLIAVMANVSILAPLLGPVMGALFIHFFNWRIIFLVISVFAVLALWGLWQFMPEPVGQIRRDGEIIKRISLKPRTVLKAYGELFATPRFLLGAIVLGLLGIPCIAWIGLAPVILVTEGKLSLIAYGLWQVPIFGACIVGNITLHRLTRHRSLRELILMGSWISCLSLLLMYILPLWKGNNYLWLMPGLLIYFFSIGLTTAPLDRFILFATPVTKGMTSALMSMMVMTIQAGGVEMANLLYKHHNNAVFALYNAIVGLICITIVKMVIKMDSIEEKED